MNKIVFKFIHFYNNILSFPLDVIPRQYLQYLYTWISKIYLTIQ
jgi:hypothetical protein